MNSIRGKLFLSVGAILLLVALLSFFMPRFFVKKDIDTAGTILSTTFAKNAKQLQLAFTTTLSGHFIEQLTELEGLTRLLSHQIPLLKEEKTLQEKAGLILQFAPTLAYIQISDGQGIATLAPENESLYIPEWVPLEKNKIALRLADGRLYTAELERGRTLFYLYPATGLESLTFKPFKDPRPHFSPSDTPDQLFAYMKWVQNQITDKAEMIQRLASKPEADGILVTNPSVDQGYVLLREDVFLQKPEIETLPLPKAPSILLRHAGNTFYLDFVRDFAMGDLKVALGYSLSSVAKQVTTILKKPILLSETGSEGILFFPDGKQVLLPSGSFNLERITYGDTVYLVEPHKVGALDISLLTPLDEAHAITQLMQKLREGLEKKISINLLLIALFVFFIALILLARLSKTMTQPIVQLAAASNEIAHGHYDRITLPNVDKKTDEIAVLTHSFEEMVIALREREKIRGALNKVVSKEIASEILKSNIELGGEERVVSLLFSDIRNFTPLSTLFSPKELIGMLNKYMTHMCRIIDTTQGVVDKFVGDEIMALYGAPLSLENHADLALEAACEMISELREWNKNQKKPLEIGIAVHTGSVCTGNMGAENRLNYTAIGANVNLASRMCGIAKPMQILVTRETIDALKNKEKFRFEPVPPVKLKGFEEPITLFEIK